MRKLSLFFLSLFQLLIILYLVKYHPKFIITYVIISILIYLPLKFKNNKESNRFDENQLRLVNFEFELLEKRIFKNKFNQSMIEGILYTRDFFNFVWESVLYLLEHNLYFFNFDRISVNNWEYNKKREQCLRTDIIIVTEDLKLFIIRLFFTIDFIEIEYFYNQNKTHSITISTKINTIEEKSIARFFRIIEKQFRKDV